MEFLLWFASRADCPIPAAEDAVEMKALAAELARQRVLRLGAPLRSASEGATVRVLDGKALVSDGPFAESREVVGGFWIVEAAGREEAIAIARRSPHAQEGVVEVHALRFRDVSPDKEDGTPFLLGFYCEPGLQDPDGAKLREMMEFSAGLRRQERLLETAPLAHDPPPARVERRAGKLWATDGPFAEAKEAIGGYAVIRAAGRAQAIELATRYPHARWGTVEVREILGFDPV